MTTLVNLDAMIYREDFEVDGDTPPTSRLPSELKLTELLRGSISADTLRKPDFQRETASWPSERIAEFVRSFLDGELIPAVIMWRSPKTGNNFVIDGAHRLSALIAWLHDDYGDEELSRPFFNNMIEPGQAKIAKKTREIIVEKIGRYRDLERYPRNPELAPTQEALVRARNIGTLKLDLQWVTGDARVAEASFFRINQSAAAINATELELIQARRKPNAVAARAIVRAGTGHKYWSNFSKEAKAEIESLAREIYEELFRPVVDYPLKTLDLPVAGSGYGPDSVKMIFDMVNDVNRPTVYKAASQPKLGPLEIADDQDGDQTIQYLKNVRRAAGRIAGQAPNSLGFHPGVYFYGATGKFLPTAFIGALLFARELDQRDQLRPFTGHRASFEQFLLEHRYFLNQIGKTQGAGYRGLPALLALYRRLLLGLQEGLTDPQLVDSFSGDPTLSFLKEPTEDDRKYGRNFTRETKNATYLREALEKALLCQICGARLHFKSITMDHVKRKADGGSGSPDNAQLAHPYCNTGYKEGSVAAERKLGGC